MSGQILNRFYLAWYDDETNTKTDMQECIAFMDCEGREIIRFNRTKREITLGSDVNISTDARVFLEEVTKLFKNMENCKEKKWKD